MKKFNKKILKNILDFYRMRYNQPKDVLSRKEAIKYYDPTISFVDFSNQDLSNLDLRYVKFINCNFFKTKLNNVNLDGSYLFMCNFIENEIWSSEIKFSNFGQSKFIRSKFMHCNFNGTAFNHSTFENSILYNCNFNQDCDFFKTRFLYTDFEESNLKDVSFLHIKKSFGSKLYNTNLQNSKFEINTFIGKIGEEIEKDYLKASITYRHIKANLETRGFYSDAGKIFVKERKMLRLSHNPFRATKFYNLDVNDKKLGILKKCLFYIKHTNFWLKDLSIEISCNYGESFFRLIFFIFFIFIFGSVLLYLFEGLKSINPEIKIQNKFFECLLFMIGIFTTNNNSLLEPANFAVRIISSIINIICIFLIGLLGFVVGNRIRKS